MKFIMKEDAICPLAYVKEFCAIVKSATLFIEDAGHSDTEPAIENRIINLLGN